jgi:membrane-bound lytic murein transglycosylase D
LPAPEGVGQVEFDPMAPDPLQPPPPPPTPAVREHIVKRGETLSEIAGLYNMSWKDLMRYNNLTKADYIVEGQVLKIPPYGQAPTVDAPMEDAGSPPPPLPPTGGQTYTVRKGDSLWEIATDHGTTVAELKRANRLQTNVLQIGQELVIPGTGAEVTTPESPMVVDDAPDADMASDVDTDLVLTDEGPVDDGGPTVIDEPVDDSPDTGDGREIIHRVKEDEDLITIAIRYNVTSTDIMKLNGLTTRKVEVGQRLRIPVRD